jgi:hypothetical protein
MYTVCNQTTHKANQQTEGKKKHRNKKGKGDKRILTMLAREKLRRGR